LIIHGSATNTIFVLSRCYMKMKKEFEYIGYLKGKAKKSIDFPSIIREFEEKGIYLQPIPCSVVLSDNTVRISAKLALEDFESGYNRAKKISTEFLLRITGRSQIKEAIDLIAEIDDRTYYLVVFSDKEKSVNVEQLLETVKMWLGEYFEFSDFQCTANLNEIKKLYNIIEKEIESVKRHNETHEDAILKLVFEKIALGIFK